ncbi:MAG: DUF3696 domain-containing protein [Gammaproteobacteria bacterium]|nr:DUF3696 domain-containing protein [Gammaproteobacteria bacterium]MCY4282356.1 DUF3696 domain-containing protein [Gammaproteobacteria bacterium]MCY4337962.1 DUF3696 domain-containing protein [Gammaproteobacteria bacterium]
MLTRLHIENLKCFSALSLPIAPLTLLTGFNAAGKSTALQPLLLLAQTMRSGGAGQRVLLNGSLTKLGTSGEAIHEQGNNKVIVFSVETEQASATWTLEADKPGETSLAVAGATFFPEPEHSSLSGAGAERLLCPSAPMSGELAALFKSVCSTVFISAMRSGTPDTFPSPMVSDPVHADVGVEGEFAPWWFERYLDDEVDVTRRHPDEDSFGFRHQLNAWLSDIFPGVDANAEKIVNTLLVRFELKTHVTEAYRRPANIGYGLTYAFPLVLALLLAKPGQVIIVDSPEAHLHPEGQSAMGSILTHFAAAGVQILIETHSDHILNGVRLAIAQKNIPPETVGVHFFNRPPRKPDDPPHVVSPLLDAKGTLSEWPRGFFDQTERDLAKLTGWE